jgi:hypothetical protein
VGYMVQADVLDMVGSSDVVGQGTNEFLRELNENS